MSRSNIEAEECVLGAMLLSRTATQRMVDELVPNDFVVPSHVAIFEAMTSLYQNGASVDPVTVADELRRRKVEVEPGKLVSLQANVPALSAAPSYAQIVRREASARLLQGSLSGAMNDIASGADPAETMDALLDQFSKLDRAGKMPERYWRDIDSYLDLDLPDAETMLIPGVCYRMTRALVIAGEKVGKSQLFRTIAYCSSQGLHPFRLRPIEPVRTLMLDAENDDDELQPTGRRIRRVIQSMLGVTWDPTNLALYSLPYGMNVMSRRDRSELEEVLEDFRPQLIVGGPLYKMLDEVDQSIDRDTARIQAFLNGIRRRWRCAMILEHHMPTGGKDGRQARSKGGQRWDAWVNITVSLTLKDGRLIVGYPHPPRGKYDWPAAFDRGKDYELPWVAVHRAREEAPSEEEPF